MKKILIVHNNMHIGGVQNALVNLLWNIYKNYEVTLLLFCPVGDKLEKLPPDIKIITPNTAYRYLGMTKHDVSSWKERLWRAFFGSITRIIGRKYAIALMALGQKCLSGYDVAISYFHNNGDRTFYGGCNEFVLRHVQAEKKVTFLHGDYMLCGANTADNAAQYNKFDLIAACSQGCADSFIKGNPSLAEKVKIVYNCHQFDKVRQQAELKPVMLDENKINLVTVARLGREKGVERALRVIARLGSLKEKLHYYIIGDGIQMPVLRQIIQQEDLSPYVTLCGALENPYGYMKAADLLLIPSYSEAAPLVIGEAACLGIPILSTETSSAREMIEETGYGWVCENTEEAMGAVLEQLLLDRSALDERKKTLADKAFGDETAVSQFEMLMDC